MGYWEDRMEKSLRERDFVKGLRELADWFEKNPELLPDYTVDISFGHLNSKSEAEKLVRAMGTCKKDFSSDLVAIRKPFGNGALKLTFCFWRNEICERVVVGTREVPAEHVEAHTRPARTEEIVEWRCSPILTPEEEK